MFGSFGSARILKIGIVLQLLLVAVFIATEKPNEPAYAENMVIDGHAYLASAREMASTGSWVFPPKTYHSPGHQVMVAALTRILYPSPFAVKLFNLLCLSATALVTFAIARRTIRNHDVSLLAVFMLVSSVTVQRYCATMQYEVSAMLVTSLAALFALRNEPARFGLAFAGLCILRLHLAISVLPLFWLLGSRHGRSAAARGLATSGALIALAWGAFSWRFDSLRGFQGFPSLQDNRWLCHDAAGWNFPYFRPNEKSVCGWTLIRHFPSEYLALLGRRFQYWIGWKHDIWWVAGYPSSIDKMLIVLNASCVAVAIFVRRIDPTIRCFAACVLLSGAPFLLAGASTRFLVPVFPLLIITTISTFLEMAVAPRVFEDAKDNDSGAGWLRQA